MSKQAKNRIFISLVLVIVTIASCVFAFIGCDSKYDFIVGIDQFVQHGALDQANEGFQTKLKELLENEKKTVKFKNQNAQGAFDMSETIAKGFADLNVDLIYAIATPAAQHCLKKATESGYDIPVIFNAVTDPVDSLLVTNRENNEYNSTGCSDLAGDGLSKQFALMLELVPDVKGIGFIYSSNEDNSRVQKENLQALINDHNAKISDTSKHIKLVEKGIAEQTDLQYAYDAIANNAQIIYMPTDNMISQNAAALHSYNKQNKKLPIVCGEIVPNEICGIATYGVSYYKLGEKAAYMAFDILMGKKAAKDIPYYQPNDLDFSVNTKVAEELGFTIPQSVLDKATK